ncbi:MAG: DUF2313 domain-containing protein [Deltaproteobacteria bacterium]|jgi:uncharacterized protein YmfQ (DUF2313 family)|nr:DUF2313 domain-containing protein [Deltaproteobacteria bacterium]
MFLALQPLGSAWTKRLSSRWARLWEASGEGLSRVEEEVLRLAREANPLYADASLEDWEAVTGLPDECSREGESRDTRRAAVVAKLQRPGGQSIDFFLKFLGPFGDKVEIQEGYPPFQASVSLAYDRLWECATGAMDDGNGGTVVDWYRGWSFVWTIIRTNHGSRRFRAGRERAGDPLVIWYLNKDGTDPNIECRINQLKPAHTQVVFDYRVDNEG